MSDLIRCQRTGWYGVLKEVRGQLAIIEARTPLQGAYRSPGEPWAFATQVKYLRPLEVPYQQEKP